VTLGGQGYYLNWTAAPNAPSVHYKWVHNVGANGVAVSMFASSTVMSDRVDNPNLANDISPFQSDSSGGIVLINAPYTTDADLANFDDWCRDMEGNEQTSGKNFTGFLYRQGLSGGVLTNEFDFEGPLASSKVLNIYQTGDTKPRVVYRGEGTLGVGDGTTNPASWGLPQAGITATTTELEDISDTINTLGKFSGRMVKNSTTDKMMFAASGTAGGVWRDAQGVSTHTPV
jgi:hypothetical protein